MFSFMKEIVVREYKSLNPRPALPEVMAISLSVQTEDKEKKSTREMRTPNKGLDNFV